MQHLRARSYRTLKPLPDSLDELPELMAHSPLLEWCRGWFRNGISYVIDHSARLGAVPPVLWPELVSQFHAQVAIVDSLELGMQTASAGADCHYIAAGPSARNDLEAWLSSPARLSAWKSADDNQRGLPCNKCGSDLPPGDLAVRLGCGHWMHQKCAGCNPEATEVACLTCEELSPGQIDRAPVYGEQDNATGSRKPLTYRPPPRYIRRVHAERPRLPATHGPQCASHLHRLR